jgi:ubiquinone/menaquinone biosynthesis C-methylase UbiE
MGCMVTVDAERRRWDRRAGFPLERWTIRDSRKWICSLAHGRTLEVAVGTGLNLPLYGRDLELTGIDINPGMLAMARRRAMELRRFIDLLETNAEMLPFPDASFDTVVCTLAVCSVADRGAAIAEMYRVVRPGGRLLLLDHLERRWIRGRPADLAVRHGFVPERRERLWMGLIERLAAHKPVTHN